MTYQPTNRPPRIAISRWQKKANYIVLTFHDGYSNYAFQAYAPDVNSPRDIKMLASFELPSQFNPPRRQSLQASLVTVLDPDRPRTDPSLVTWGTGGNEAVFLRFFVPQLYERWEFVVNLPVLTTFERLDGVFKT